MSQNVKLVGERVALREWRHDELAGMHRWLGNSQVKRYLSWGSASVAQSASHLRETVEGQTRQPRLNYYLAIELKTSGQTIGDAGFSWLAQTSAEIGYFLESDYWGQSYATEAARLVVDYALRLGAERVIASCDSRNHRSERVMQRCGMARCPSSAPLRLTYEIASPE